MAAGFWRATAAGVNISVRVTSRANADCVDGVETRADGMAVLRVRVRAPPDKGRANAAVVVVMAAALDVPSSAVRVAAGSASRLKTIAVDGDGAILGQRLAAMATG